MTNSIAASGLRAELVELTAERDPLRAQLAGDLPAATRWLPPTVGRQGTACRNSPDLREYDKRLPTRFLFSAKVLSARTGSTSRASFAAFSAGDTPTSQKPVGYHHLPLGR